MSWGKLFKDVSKALKVSNGGKSKKNTGTIARIEASHRSEIVILESLEIIENSTNWGTKKSRIAVVIKTAELLSKTSIFPTTREKMKNALPQYKAQQIEIHIDALKTKVNSDVSKAHKLKSNDAKLRALSKVHEYIYQVQNNDQFVPYEIIEHMKNMVDMGIERLKQTNS